LIFALGIALIIWVFRSNPTAKPEDITISQVVTMSQASEIKTLNVQGQTLNITGTDGKTYKSFLPDNVNIYQVADLKIAEPMVINFQPNSIDWGTILFTFGPILLMVGILFFFLFRARGANNQAMSFGRSNARLFPGDKPQVTFNDVAGVDEAKQELHEVVDFLKARERFTALGARIPAVSCSSDLPAPVKPSWRKPLPEKPVCLSSRSAVVNL